MHDFSIIIPHKNIPDLLKRCLGTIPDDPTIQVIIVDDNSDSEKVDFNNFPGKNRENTICIFDKNGGGAGHARNIGLKHADGKWLVFADADDLFVEEFHDLLKKYVNADADIVLFKAESVFSDTLKPANNRYNKHNDAVDRALGNKISPKEAVLVEPGPCARIFLREHISKNEIQFEEIMSSNDVMFVLKATCWANKVEVCGEPLYVVTTRQGSLVDKTKKNPDNYLLKMEVSIRRNKFLKDYPFPKRPIIAQVLKSYKFGLSVFLRAFSIAVKNNALFSGLGYALKSRLKNLF